MIKIRPVNASDAVQLAPRLREADRREISAVVGSDPLVALKNCVDLSIPCYAIADASVPYALFGVVPDSDTKGQGSVWLLGSDKLVEHPFFVIRHSRLWVERLQDHYKVLWNCVDARNVVHIRWLKWSGFTFLRRIEKYGVEQRPFYEFEKLRR